ncbi:hypothetical protein [endosymbiont GvMRE of Glomus versiforme]|uniref:hypothetical protein n=1 Tax=endosymbiont GvMRE of Glomus versiforme TaxID=2039283 RepID=UPI000EDDF8E7|nr:hypothetical protein [endosymbiont GvMRE of Glomus versiforme]RHZ36599.1 hypothetical protein GvMRE_I2g552 [endosymbiont GvMRE of Glomus versiforme]RHZ37427.1 hypothetical protein GvMRE_I1g730 [endosymbiont GvMRE of Glomus versiforme]
MNKYQILKYAIIGLTITSRTASLASFIKPELTIIPKYAEPTKQVLIQAGNAYWNYELSQQKLPYHTCQPEQDFILINSA